jgi:hypothetical protein
LWFAVVVVNAEVRIRSLEAQDITVCSSPSPDGPIGIVALVLQSTGLVIARTSKDRKPLLVYLLAAPVPVLLGLLSTWEEYRHLDALIARGVMLLPDEIAAKRSEFVTHTYFGLAAGDLVLLVGIWGLTSKKFRAGAESRPEAATPPAAAPGRFQFTIRAALIVMTAWAVGLSAASYCERPVLVSCIFAVVGTSVLTVTYGGDYGCSLSVILLCLCFGGICAVGPDEPHPVGLIGFPLSLMLVAIVWRAMRRKRNSKPEPEDAAK